jgi:hypothetical protein
MSTINNTDLFLVSRAGVNYKVTGATIAAFVGGVSSFSAGTTGLTPSASTLGAVVLSGILNVANGGTGLSSVGTNGQVLTTNGTTLSYGSSIVIDTAVASTSGTSINFTGIPSWVKRVTVMFNAVSTNGTSNYLVQVGSGSVTTSGYIGQANSGAGISGNSAGFIVCNNVGSANTHAGAATILSFGSNTYIEAGLVGATTNVASMSTSEGAVTLGGALDRIRVTTVNGTDTFDAGSINILYE